MALWLDEDTDWSVRTLHYCGRGEAMDLVPTSRAWADVRTAHDRRLLEGFRAMADADPHVILYESGEHFSVHIDLSDDPTPPKYAMTPPWVVRGPRPVRQESE